MLRALRASQHLKTAAVLQANGTKPTLSIEATPEIIAEVSVLGHAIKQAQVSLKKEDLKHPFAWLAGKMKGVLETAIEKYDGAQWGVQDVSTKVRAVTFIAH